MTSIIAQLGADAPGVGGALYRDYLAGGGEVERRLGRHDARALAASAVRKAGPVDAALRAALSSFNREIGVSAPVIAKLENPGTRYVLTGQQPGALGGPLMTLYKIATALALAEHVEAESGVPAVALYWMGADDVDFAEVRELVAPAPDLTPLSASIAASAHEAALQVGEIPADALERLWRGVAPLLAPGPARVPAAELVESALASGGDNGAVTARIVAGLTRGSVAVVDSRDPVLRETAGPLVLSFFDAEADARAEVEASGRTLEAAGLHAQLWTGPDSGVFISRAGRRIKIPDAGRAEAREAIAASPREVSAGVVLRNLVQDSVFSPVAVVLGAAEIAYRAQIAPLYDRFDVVLPVSMARLSATWVPPPVAGVEGFDAGALVRDPVAWVQSVFAGQAPPELDAAREALLAQYRVARDAFVEVVNRAAGDRTAGRAGKRLEDITRRLEQATDVVGESGRERALDRWPFLEHAADLFARQDRPQERYLSMLSPYLRDNADVWGTVCEAARAHVPGAMDGNAMHVVYSI